MKKEMAIPGIVGILTALLSITVTLKTFGQTGPEYADNVPLTYTILTWEARSMSPDATDGDEKLKRGVRRSDGSTALARYLPAANGATVERRLIVDLEQAQIRALDSSVKSVTTQHMTAGAVTNQRERRPACNGQIVGAVLEYDVVRIDSSFPAPAGLSRMRSESLVAPDLGCLPLEERLIMVYDDGSERDLRVSRVVGVRIGEPDDAYFRVPEDYVEMSPAAHMEALGFEAADISRDLLIQNAQQNYLSGQQQ